MGSWGGFGGLWVVSTSLMTAWLLLGHPVLQFEDCELVVEVAGNKSDFIKKYSNHWKNVKVPDNPNWLAIQSRKHEALV